MSDDYCDDFDDRDDSDEEEALDNCMMGDDGQCGAAGSEQCDFDCPIMRDRRDAARMRANRAAKRRDEKRGPKLPGIDP